MVRNKYPNNLKSGSRNQTMKIVFFCSHIIFILYVDDSIFMAQHNHFIDHAMVDLIASSLKIEDQEYSSNYVGVNVKQIRKETISLL